MQNEKLKNLIQILRGNPNRSLYKTGESDGRYTYTIPGDLPRGYYSPDEIRQLVVDGWLIDKYPNEPVMVGKVYVLSDKQSGVACQDCGIPYPFEFDCVLPNAQWKRIIGRNDGGGILCANCIVRRGGKAFHKATVVRMRFV